MTCINYDEDNYCGPCDNRFSKSKGVNCPECGRRSRTSPRVPANKNFPRM